MFEALLNTELDLDSLGPDSVLEEEWIKEAVTRSGMKFRWAKLSESRERPNRDARRRYVTGREDERREERERERGIEEEQEGRETDGSVRVSRPIRRESCCL